MATSFLPPAMMRQKGTNQCSVCSSGRDEHSSCRQKESKVSRGDNMPRERRIASTVGWNDCGPHTCYKSRPAPVPMYTPTHCRENPWCSCILILRRPAQPLIGERGTVSCPLDLRALLHGTQAYFVPTFSQKYPGPRTPPRTSSTGLHQPFLLSAGRLQRSLTRIFRIFMS